MKKSQILIFTILICITLLPGLANSKTVNSVGLGLGACLPQGGWDPGYSIMAQGDFGEVIKYIYLTPYISYAHASKSEEVHTNTEQFSIQYLGLGAKFYGYLNSKPRGFYLGGAISYNLISYDTIKWADFPENTKIENTSTNQVGFSGLAGYLFMLKKLSIFIEVNYMLTVSGFNTLSGFAGVNINL